MAIDFTKYTTRALLNMRFNGFLEQTISYDAMNEEQLLQYHENERALYAELNTREHVPNKIDGYNKRVEEATKHRKSKKVLQYKR